MTLRIDSVQPRRERSVVVLDIVGKLPNYSYTIGRHQTRIDGPRIMIDFPVTKSDGMAGQAVSTVTRSVDLGRFPGGTYQLTVTCNGEPCHSERLAVPG